MLPVRRKAVYTNPDLPKGAVDRDAYVMCVLEQLHRVLTNRDVFTSPSPRRFSPRARRPACRTSPTGTPSRRRF
ncbi:hypothetical protein SSPIM334S_07019 [Streptomyces spiroverticillatus]